MVVAGRVVCQQRYFYASIGMGLLGAKLEVSHFKYPRAFYPPSPFLISLTDLGRHSTTNHHIDKEIDSDC